ncbi:MAG: iron-containing alcohol dehydrogenase [Hespellia sp.]|jgi:alcohol dehydrogenase YqhD (iron-dependent ADH family)|nr:iron-containing alcohol dehydrogenase [Hespellia sp.]
MDHFEFMSPTKFILQKDADKLCGEEIKKISDSCLFVHYGDGFTYKSGLHDRIIESLESAGLEYYELPGVEPNPKVSLVRKGIELCKEKNIGCVLAVGGGSVIDTAKAVAIGAKYDGDVWDFYSKKAIPTESLPVGTVMTLPATGSEGSNGSVLKNAQTGESADVMADFIRPAFTLMNPDLTLTIPKRQTVFGIVDMFSHVMERYFSSSVNVNLTDYMCEGVMKSIIVNARALMKDLNDYNARAELMWTSIVAHNGLLATGRNQDWATHTMGAQLSAQYNAVHGSTLSVLFPCWAEYVYKENIPRFVQFANRVFGVDVDFYDQEKTALEGIKRLREFFESMDAPTSLEKIGVENDEKFRKMAEDACRFGNIGGLKTLNADDVEAIYKMAQ